MNVILRNRAFPLLQQARAFDSSFERLVGSLLENAALAPRMNVVDTGAAYRSLTRSWFEHSSLFGMLRTLAESVPNARIVLTTDHGYSDEDQARLGEYRAAQTRKVQDEPL